MSYSCRIFQSPEHVRDAVLNIYQGNVLFTHMTGFPHPTKEAAVRTAKARTTRVLYRINVRMKDHVKGNVRQQETVSDVQAR
jgi:hypothetical protein